MGIRPENRIMGRQSSLWGGDPSPPSPRLFAEAEFYVRVSHCRLTPTRLRRPAHPSLVGKGWLGGILGAGEERPECMRHTTRSALPPAFTIGKIITQADIENGTYVPILFRFFWGLAPEVSMSNGQLSLGTSIWWYTGTRKHRLRGRHN